MQLLISIARHKMYETPEFTEIDGLKEDCVKNFRTLSDAIDDAEDTLQKTINAEEDKKALAEFMNQPK